MKFTIGMAGSETEKVMFEGRGETLLEAVDGLIGELERFEREVGSDNKAYASLNELQAVHRHMRELFV